MVRSGKTGFVAAAATAAATSLGALLFAAPRPTPVGRGLERQYIMALGTNAKTGTSIAASQNEFAHRTMASISSTCAAGACVATVNNPAPPKNDTMPRTVEFIWNGSQWVREFTWKWDCLLPDGTIEYDPAKSITVYTPGEYGILTGVFHTDILSGTCKGNVDMPVSAKPATPPVT